MEKEFSHGLPVKEYLYSWSAGYCNSFSWTWWSKCGNKSFHQCDRARRSSAVRSGSKLHVAKQTIDLETTDTHTHTRVPTHTYQLSVNRSSQLQVLCNVTCTRKHVGVSSWVELAKEHVQHAHHKYIRKRHALGRVALGIQPTSARRRWTPKLQTCLLNRLAQYDSAFDHVCILFFWQATKTPKYCMEGRRKAGIQLCSSWPEQRQRNVWLLIWWA